MERVGCFRRHPSRSNSHVWLLPPLLWVQSIPPNVGLRPQDLSLSLRWSMAAGEFVRQRLVSLGTTPPDSTLIGGEASGPLGAQACPPDVIVHQMEGTA